MKKAFSLIEVVFVIVILGIVASISSQIIVQVYDNYITQKAIYKVSTKTELVANQIVNRLTYAIEESAVIKTFKFKTNAIHKLKDDWKKMDDINDTDNFSIVEWIGYDNDSFSAGETPYWSGVANYKDSNESSLVSPASNFNDVNTTISNLSNKKVDLSGSKILPVVIFPYVDDPKDKKYKHNYPYASELYPPKCMGLIDNNTSCIFKVKIKNNYSLSFVGNKPKVIAERYKLAWSAYALVPEKQPNGLYNLYLRYNYQPWNGDHFYDNNTPKSLILTNMSVFKFTKNGGSIQFKLCATEDIGQDYNISTCKEKVIIR
ncbi:MAG: prepilin-type N-terminal cleavage/methylation domain-containing protein [Sulfurovaceae bacterium]|nr:prepilin-type N-terminal cleavage/methylation domain-containing protein [Sulfurovaceae bacterium]